MPPGLWAGGCAWALGRGQFGSRHPTSFLGCGLGGVARWLAACGLARRVRAASVQDEHFSDVLYRFGHELSADLGEPQRPLVTIVARRLDFDEFVLRQLAVDFCQHFRRKALVSDHRHGGQRVRFTLQRLPPGGREGGIHRLIILLRSLPDPECQMAQSSRAWLKRHVNDPYVQRSVADGYRSRAAYKLMEIDDRDRLLTRGAMVVDLGCAPGGWSQVAAERVGRQGGVVGIDLLALPPIPGAVLLQADFMTEAGAAAVARSLAGRAVDVVLSDMAPNLSGVELRDQARHFELAEAALDFALRMLSPQGRFLVKTFQGVGFQEYLALLRRHFAQVATRKPKASRQESREVFLLAGGRQSDFLPDRH
jgi:23S rRNA (uridine2552-2'-O)-methyltransferase